MISVLCFVWLVSVAAAQKASTSNPSRGPLTYRNSTKQSVENAVAYLLSQRHSDYGWGSSTATSRANVALAFASRLFQMDANETKLMIKQLEIQLSLGLISNSPINLSHLALYINAVYATCQDPRNFHGIDLVHRLREKTTEAMRSNFVLPFVLMTICISGENTYQDDELLTKIYTSSQIMSVRAITVLAMACIGRASNNPSRFIHYFRDFSQKVATLKNDNLDTHTRALIVQAANAVPLQHSITLKEYQLPDGSFGDLLATYYAIPALLNSSLLDLKCAGSNQTRVFFPGMSASYTAASPTDKVVTVSLRIAAASDYNTHSTVVTSKGNETLYEIMKTAEAKDSMYRILCDKTKNGQEIYSLAGFPNDPEMGMSWKLYLDLSGSATANSKKKMKKLSSGINYVFPVDKSHFVFMFDHS